MICRGLFKFNFPLTITQRLIIHSSSYPAFIKCFIGLDRYNRVSHHLSVFSTQVLQLLLHPLECLQKVIVLPGQPLVLLENGLHLALSLSHPF